MPDTSSPLIEISGVTYAPGETTVLRDIHLLADERRIGVVGRNGSGKTSLARVMAGLVVPSSGRVRIAGVDVVNDRKGALGAVGILFQNPDHQIIFPTVQEEIAFGLNQMGQDHHAATQAVDAILARFDRTHWAPAAVHRLSQGQRQLVCLMSILAMQPRVIILDEPFAGLDIPTALHLSRVLDSLDVTLVQISHAPDSLHHYDRVLWVDDGRIVEDGGAAEVLKVFTARMTELGGTDDFAYLAG